MKNLSILFGIAMAGVVVSFGMSIFTAVRSHQSEVAATPVVVPTPAF